jgi:hypothetical protein
MKGARKMTFPGFSGEASAYQTTSLYRAFASVSYKQPLGGAVYPAYRPSPATQAECSQCNDGCDSDNNFCNAEITALDAACVFFVPGACAAAAYGHAICNAEWVGCRAFCLFGYCCPKVCGVPDPTRPGEGCCDFGEHCVDENDPNARSGCCAPDRHVCGGKCCGLGEVCVGDFCCPSGATTVCNGVCCAGSCTKAGNCCVSPNHPCGDDNCCPPFNKCCNGQCCDVYQECHPTLGTCWTPPTPPRPVSPCRAGWTACAGQCCPPGKQCCSPGGSGLPLGCYEGYQCLA